MLKRKIEEDSLSETSHESCDSLDSGDSTKAKQRRVRFYDRTVFHFPRTQGSGCVPSNGGYTLGMKRKHSFVEHFKFGDYEDNLKFCFASDSDSEEDDEDDEQLFMPIPQKTRKEILKDAGVKKIDKQEATECMEIRYSRQVCGCDCKTFCDPATCSCSLNGINCQVDRDDFPCGCSKDACQNPQGRHEYDPISVRKHFIDTVLKLRGQKYIWENQTGNRNNATSNSVISFAVS